MDEIKQDNLPTEKAEQVEEENESEKKYASLSNRTLASIVAVSIVVSALFGAIFGFMSAGVVGFFAPTITQKIHQYFPQLQQKSVATQVNKQQVIVEDSAVIGVVQKSTPAVVSIIVSTKTNANSSALGGGFFDPFGGGFGMGPQTQGGTQQQISEGSGFFITTDGLILTNRHVVEDPQATYTVVANDGAQYPATVLAIDPVRDIAVIKVAGNDFPILPLGDSDSLQIGQTTIAIGNSLGELTNSVSRGIVSGLKRNVDAGSLLGSTERLTDIIQTDAAINPGNSGGPLIDIDGNVIGINVAMAQGAQNIGFALPINQAKRIIDQVKTGKKITIPYIGVRYIAIDPVIQKQAQLPFDYGVLVARGTNATDLAVIPGSPADIAGITENDIILEVDGEKITPDNQMEDIISRHNVGDNVNLKIWHKGQIKNVQVTLQELKQ